MLLLHAPIIEQWLNTFQRNTFCGCFIPTAIFLAHPQISPMFSWCQLIPSIAAVVSESSLHPSSVADGTMFSSESTLGSPAHCTRGQQWCTKSKRITIWESRECKVTVKLVCRSTIWGGLPHLYTMAEIQSCNLISQDYNFPKSSVSRKCSIYNIAGWKWVAWYTNDVVAACHNFHLLASIFTITPSIV